MPLLRSLAARLRAGRNGLRADPDRGAVAVILAVFLSGAMLALALITVDVGSAYSEHRQVRNGADAAVLAVARACALPRAGSASTAAECDADTERVTQALVDANAVDDATHVERICASPAAAITRLPTCRIDDLAPAVAGTSDRSPLSSCPALPSGSTPRTLRYVEVRTRTGSESGRGALAPLFGEDPVPVAACARAGIGPPTALTTTFPIAVSRCVVEKQWPLFHGRLGLFGSTSLLAPRPPYSALLRAKWEMSVSLRTPGFLAPCRTSSSLGVTGNFGLLASGGASGCRADTRIGVAARGTVLRTDLEAELGVTLGCDKAHLRALIGTTVHLPVFDSATSVGGRVEYRVVGYAAFHLRGWSAQGRTEGSVSTTCGRNETCLHGMFTSDFVPASASLDVSASAQGRDYGTASAALVG